MAQLGYELFCLKIKNFSLQFLLLLRNKDHSGFVKCLHVNATERLIRVIKLRSLQLQKLFCHWKRSADSFTWLLQNLIVLDWHFGSISKEYFIKVKQVSSLMIGSYFSDSVTATRSILPKLLRVRLSRFDSRMSSFVASSQSFILAL